MKKKKKEGRRKKNSIKKEKAGKNVITIEIGKKGAKEEKSGNGRNRKEKI